MATEKQPAKAIKRQDDGKFIKGVSGNPDGPQKGYKKLKTKLVEEKLAVLDYDPIRAMVDLAKDDETPVAVRAKLASELASFVWPKRKAIEHSGSLGKSNAQEYTNEELEAIITGGSGEGTS